MFKDIRGSFLEGSNTQDQDGGVRTGHGLNQQRIWINRVYCSRVVTSVSVRGLNNYSVKSTINSIKQNSTQETDSRSSSQEIPRHL
jgi:hypothetical protein